ncbi:MAG: pirin family protein [Casimicrobiaceae bacterium]|nr:pirin family protein [Casimicrobiaceae bacterium]MDW8311189.1 pirin family protein [Burkholderiales bacterium]
MLTLRKSNERGQADRGWLQSRFSFSFAEYHDPEHMHFGPLRVINDDWIAPGAGFGMHGHRDMEIVTYVLEGAVAHRDSLGNASIITPGEVQRMSAGSGILHSEFNPSSSERTHLLQIWILPELAGGPPSYEQKRFAESELRGRLRLVASRDGAEGSVTIKQAVRLYAGRFDAGESTSLTLAPGRLGYVHVARGEIAVNGVRLAEGDAAKLEGEPAVVLSEGRGAEVLLFDLPGAAWPGSR